MSAQRELQQAFGQLLRDPQAPADAFVAAHCLGDAGMALRGLEAYRRNTLGNRAAAVVASYPVVASIVGETFMWEAAWHFARAKDSHSGDLNLYGAELGAFLDAFAPAADVPYLGAVARMEWAVQQLATCPPSPAPALSGLQHLPADAWDALRFQLDPAHRLIASRWPLQRLWQINQPQYSGDYAVDLAQGDWVLLHRRGGVVHIESITPAHYAFLQALGTGAALAQACAQALELDAAFPLAELLSRSLQSTLILALDTLEHRDGI